MLSVQHDRVARIQQEEAMRMVAVGRTTPSPLVG